MKTRVAVLYWLDRRGRIDVWFGAPGAKGRPAGAVDVVMAAGRPYCRGDVVEGEQVGPPWSSAYRAAAGKVLVVGIPVPQS